MERNSNDNVIKQRLKADNLDLIDRESGQIEIDPELEKPFVDKEGLLIDKDEQIEMMHMDGLMRTGGVNWGKDVEID